MVQPAPSEARRPEVGHTREGRPQLLTPEEDTGTRLRGYELLEAARGSSMDHVAGIGPPARTEVDQSCTALAAADSLAHEDQTGVEGAADRLQAAVQEEEDNRSSCLARRSGGQDSRDPGEVEGRSPELGDRASREESQRQPC